MTVRPLDRLKEGIFEELLSQGKDWALIHGLLMRDHRWKNKSDTGVVAPFALLPTPFPRSLLQTGYLIQEDMSLLYFRCSLDQKFLEAALESVVKTDVFTRKLLEIYRLVMAEGMGQSKVLQVQRSDYMAHISQGTPDDPKSYSLKQIEVNNIASSFACLADRCTRWHQMALQDLGYSPKEIGNHLPVNKAEETVLSGLVKSWEAYGNPEAVILLVAEDLNQNIADQRLLEFGARERTHFKANTVRMTLSQCEEELVLDPGTKVLRVQDPTRLMDGREVAVIYFRSGYVPKHYHGEKEWSARLKLERSKAIKCPWIGLHLSGTKKVQQVLAGPNFVEKFLFDRPKEAIKRVRDCFAGMWGLEGGGNEVVLEEVRKRAEDFVLKPQLEGGGNNIYGKTIPGYLEKLSPEEQEAYILMERIQPPSNKAYLVRPDKSVALANTISELGIYGHLLGDTATGEVLSSVSDGHLLRTKTVGVEEGGIMAGASALDSPFLF